MTTAINVAVIGGGHWGKNLIREFNNINSLHSIVELNTNLHEHYSRQYPNVQVTNNFQEVLEDDNIHSVCIALPAGLHYQFANDALEYNKDVFIEKPITLDTNDAKKLIDKASQNSKIIMVGHLLHYHPAIVKMKQMLNAGDIGTIKHISCIRESLGIFRNNENALWSLGPHDVSVIMDLCKDYSLRNVKCTGSAIINKDIYDIVDSVLEFSKQDYKCTATIKSSWLAPVKNQIITVTGTSGILSYDDVSKRLVYKSKYIDRDFQPVKGNEEVIIWNNKQQPLSLECEHFIKCCELRSTPITPGHEGASVLEVLTQLQSELEGEKA